MPLINVPAGGSYARVNYQTSPLEAYRRQGDEIGSGYCRGADFDRFYLVAISISTRRSANKGNWVRSIAICV